MRLDNFKKAVAKLDENDEAVATFICIEWLKGYSLIMKSADAKFYSAVLDAIAKRTEE